MRVIAILWKASIIVAMLVVYSSVLATPSFTPVFNPELKISKTSEAIKIDGKIDEAVWKTASRADNFVERRPGDKTKPDVETEAYITYDDDKLYVAFICYDDPSSIRATMCQRDRFYGDDAVGLMVDTYGDAAWAYEFFVNPYGVQMDFLWSSITGEDRGYDMIWESAAQINQSGYQVEMAIPFASMRFPSDDVQKWKVDFGRNRPRETEYRYNWAAYDRDEQCWPCQWGSVDGISNVQPGKGLEIMPTVIANQSGSLADYDNPDSPFDNSDPNAEVSLGGKYSINSNFTLEASYNPDFSQIEADAAQIDVNSTIALFYPERRPFFQEGSDIFRTIFNAFYTRTVNDPQFAAKLTGRVNRFSIGFLSAHDENTPYMIPLSESGSIVNTGKSYVNVLRATRTFGEDSQLGMILTDRRFDGGGSGTVAGIDGSIRLADNYRVVGQYVTSHTIEQDDSVLSEGLDDTFDDDKYTAAFDGESFSGDAFITQLRRRARNWNFTIDYNQVAPAYRTETGYDPWNDYRNFSIFTRYAFYIENGIFEQITPMANFDSRFKFNNDRRWANLNMGIESHIRFAQTYFSAWYSKGTETWDDLEYKDLWSAEFDLGSTINDQLGYYVGFDIGHAVAFGPQAVGQETELYAEVDLKPLDRLIIEPNVSFLRSSGIDGIDTTYYSGYITRTRFRYQANKELSVRLVVQYNDFSERWDFDPLITYRISPFSVFYFGSTHDVTKLYYESADPDQWKQTERQFFMKLQYLFRT
ncbi:MAG: carbohydrate binding family 9 domain-containing protein [candidate division Zixibacteria bacterium]|nr:carbohydrate binding family 9 domain-containing protein [candidate division Zixibacteria bacterium]